MQHIERQSWPLLCTLELNRRLSGQVRGRNLKSYFPPSHSLTRMPDKASCQQGQEKGITANYGTVKAVAMAIRLNIL